MTSFLIITLCVLLVMSNIFWAFLHFETNNMWTEYVLELIEYLYSEGEEDYSDDEGDDENVHRFPVL